MSAAPSIPGGVLLALGAARELLTFHTQAGNAEEGTSPHVLAFVEYFLPHARALGAEVRDAVNAGQYDHAEATYTELRDYLGAFHDLYGQEDMEAWPDCMGVPARLPAWGSA